MAITLLDQETQVRNTAPVALYIDSVAPSEANFETNPVSLLDDLNNVRSQLSNLLDIQANDWWTDLNVPSALDTGTQRGVNNLNTDLHALERKRVLVKAVSLADVAVGAAAAATGILTLTGQPLDTETVTIGTKTYQFQTALTNVDGNVLIGASASDSLDNLIAAIQLGAGAGSLYAAATTANGFVSAAAGAGDTMDVTALKAGTFGNIIASTETLTNGSWGGATLSGGAGGDVVVLGVGELPPNIIAAVGAVTTQGTVVSDPVTALGTASLNEVAGSNAIAPKNFVEVVDVATRDPILSDGRVIYGLLQGETGLADGDTILDAASDRVQVTFVRINSLGTDLETIDGADLGSNSVFLCFTERKALEDLTEQDFLRGAVTDVPASSTVTRQAAYDNQGTSPVDQTTDATLDLEGAGLAWSIRDDLQAELFAVVEGSAGGTSVVRVAADVDTFDVNAAVNDFLQGVTIDSGGTAINVGVTGGQIDAGSALVVKTTAGILTVESADDLILNDGNMIAEGTWAGPGVKVSDTTAEVVAYETAFGGEVSLFNAIVQAKNSATRRRVFAVCTTNAAADVDISGPSNDNNIDADLGDLSGGTFTSDYDLYHNGQYQRPGASAAANFDWYPGTALANGQIKLEKKLKTGDTLALIDYINP